MLSLYSHFLQSSSTHLLSLKPCIISCALLLFNIFSNESLNIFPKGMIEDMFVYHDGEKYIMIAEDAGGAYTGLKKGGVRFLSHDGITWDEDSAVPAYGFNITYDDGRTEELQRRERPMILFDNDKKYLFTSAKINGELKLEGGDTWNMVQEFVNVSN